MYINLIEKYFEIIAILVPYICHPSDQKAISISDRKESDFVRGLIVYIGNRQ